MKIAVIGTRGFPDVQGGVEKHCEGLYSSMPEDFSITVFRRKAFINKNASKRYKQIRFIDLFSTKIKGFESFFHSFLATVYCIFYRQDIVHVHNIGPGIFIPLLKLFRHKVVLTYHSTNYEHKKWNWFGKLILKIGEKFALGGADIIIFVNKAQLKKVSKKIQKKSCYIPNGVRLEGRSYQTVFLEKYNLVPKKYILAVGRFVPEKNFDQLIRAFTAVQDKKGYRLVIAGDADFADSYSVELKKMAQKNNVVLTGFIKGDELQTVLNNASVFVLPSSHEGLPISLLEAMSYGLPAIVSDIPANKEVNLPTDSYFRVNEESELTEKLQQHILQGYQPVTYDMTPYDWDKIAEQTIEVYQSVK